MFAFWSPGPTELIIILVVALLIFGKRLPEVARSLGKGIVEFKKGVRGIEEDIDTEAVRPLAPPPIESAPQTIPQSSQAVPSGIDSSGIDSSDSAGDGSSSSDDASTASAGSSSASASSGASSSGDTSSGAGDSEAASRVEDKQPQ